MPHAQTSGILRENQAAEGGYAYVTLHQPPNADAPSTVAAIMGELKNLSESLAVVFAMHPRTRQRLSGFAISCTANGRLRIIEPVGYYDSFRMSASWTAFLAKEGHWCAANACTEAALRLLAAPDDALAKAETAPGQGRTAGCVRARLATEEKLRAMEAIWADLGRHDEDIPSPPWHERLLQERKDRVRSGQGTFIDWDTAKKQLRDRLA